jgi:hypothetical protein
MDPNATLKSIMYKVERVHRWLKKDGTIGMDQEMTDVFVGELADQIEALDGWITSGGFLPERWNVKGDK